jgi:hypothetical protein
MFAPRREARKPHAAGKKIIISPDFGPGHAKAGGEFEAS